MANVMGSYFFIGVFSSLACGGLTLAYMSERPASSSPRILDYLLPVGVGALMLFTAYLSDLHKPYLDKIDELKGEKLGEYRCKRASKIEIPPILDKSEN